MSIIRIANPDAIRPGHVVMIVLILLTLAGSCLLYSGAQSFTLPDGAREWPAGSLLRPLVAMLNFNYTQPTPNGSDVKVLVFGLGAALAVLSVGIAVAARPRGGEETDEGDTVITDPAVQDRIVDASVKRSLSPLAAAQALMLVYLAWSFASIAWSGAADVALYGSLELALYTLWSFALAYGLSRASARYGAYALVAVLALTSAVALGYHLERNPTLRASFPIGNPTTLAACLIPGLLIAAGVLVAQVRDFGNPRRVRRVIIALLCLGVLVLMLIVFRRASARGALLGLAGGLGALFFFALRKRGKFAVLVVALISSVAAGWYLLPQLTTHSPTGRDASFRLRHYSWNYALDLVGERKLQGHGQGGYVRKADALAGGKDVLKDPEALTARIAHAHNEWLEVWTDLGSVGVVVVFGMLLFTLAGGAQTVRVLPTVTRRWVLIALLASLTALIMEEASGVGLRLAGLPVIYYTVIGLIWAFCTPEQPGLVRVLGSNRPARALSILAGVVLAFSAAYVSIRDFQAARAEYEVAGAIDELEWQRAITLADTAQAHRLGPQRRLVAQARLCAAYLRIARAHLVNGRRRLATALQSAPPDQRLRALAEGDLHTAEACRRSGVEALSSLVRKAPNFYNSNWLEYGFYQVSAEFARLLDDPERARNYDRDSAVALGRELARRPYDTNMARLYVIAAGSVISLEEICATLARPLRYNSLPVAYHDGVTRLLAIPTFEQRFLPLYQRARSAAPTDEPVSWADPFAPETLRLAAVIWSESGNPQLAEETLEHANSLYAALEPRFAYGAAACLAELADRRFLNDPADPASAIRDAEQAIKRAPPSNEGRQLQHAVRGLLVGMQLAAGDEAAARASLREMDASAAAPTLQAVLSTAYTGLISMLVLREEEADVGKLHQWADRAIELNADNELAWRQKADIAFRERGDDECVRCLREARRRGAPGEAIYRFVDVALRERPTSKPLLDYSRELGAELNAAPRNSAPPAGFQENPQSQRY